MSITHAEGAATPLLAGGSADDEARCETIEALRTERLPIEVHDVTALLCGRPVDERRMRVLLRH